MFDFLLPKTKIQTYNFREVPIEELEVIGVGQINPYCNRQYDNEMFITVLNIANDSKNYDEKEGLVLTKYFTVKKCPRCKKIELVPVKIKINMDLTYQKYEEEIAYDAYEENPSKRHLPSYVNAFCNSCSACFEFRIKSKDTWIKEAKRIKERDLIDSQWNEYCLD